MGVNGDARSLVRRLDEEANNPGLETLRHVLGGNAGERAAGMLPAVVGQEHAALCAQQRVFTVLASRFDESGPAGFFLSLASAAVSSRVCLTRLVEGAPGFSSWVQSRSPAGIRSFERVLCRSALLGGRAEVAAALHVAMISWGKQCALFAHALRSEGDFATAFAEYFAAYAEPPRTLLAQAVEVVEAGLADGEDPSVVSATVEDFRMSLSDFWLLAASSPTKESIRDDHELADA
ncbi:hypothetical protein CDG81_15245 [Actinopolyspora erythraea]|uniref:Thiaminase-2/PQQC domain-containing protein n=1 Tax=Actinopolyspora erythraea TaxID=414996 RepID=A0A099D4N2_9ACTN|nr:hypothetical protein [Actinopolyspora erythraea]ASU79416.1 hypothetical protein CDG81_15245 [Actinopolyspora erythraea]KGI80969.1 hypothetical protein IL38_14510 [Actinopolyspora erythraea]